MFVLSRLCVFEFSHSQDPQRTFGRHLLGSKGGLTDPQCLKFDLPSRSALSCPCAKFCMLEASVGARHVLLDHFHCNLRSRSSVLVWTLHCRICGTERALQTRLVLLGRAVLSVVSYSVDGLGAPAKEIRPPQLAASFASNVTCWRRAGVIAGSIFSIVPRKQEPN